MKIRSVKDIKNLRGKRVLVRVDFNVPVKNGRVQDDYRIKKGLPTIEYLLKRGARVIIVTHRGRPKGFDKKLSLKPVARHLARLLKTDVPLVPLTHWSAVAKSASMVKPGRLLMLENIRFLSGEETNDSKLAQALAGLADIFVLDGFAVAHRAAASVSGVAKFLPSYAGLLVASEIAGLSQAIEHPKKPLVIILGGAKAETKIPVLKNLLLQADHILVSGGVANTYLWAKGYAVGGSLVDKALKSQILTYCKNKKVVLPVDFIVGKSDGSGARQVLLDKKFRVTNKAESLYDIGPATTRLFASYIKKAQTLIWNGPPGMFEVHPYEFGAKALAEIFAARSKGKAFGVVGGGETVQLLQQMKLAPQVDLVSTGGGAMLEFLSGKSLPGIEVLRHKR